MQDFHTYHIGELGVWVHNADCCDLTPAQKYNIPDRKDFGAWFDSKTVSKIAELYKNPEVRDVLKSRLRNGGNKHEWLMGSRMAQTKAWGVKYDDIIKLTSPTKNTYFKDPKTGEIRKHGTNSISVQAHKELGDIIDSSNNFAQFKRKINNWAEYSGRLPNGRDDLPKGLKQE